MSVGVVRKARISKGKEETFFQKEAKSLNLKYMPKTLIPSDLIEGDSRDQSYILLTGEHVIFEYLRGINNTDGINASLLDNISKDLYNMPFPKVELAWKMRIGILNNHWYVIKITKIDDKTA